MKEFVTSWGNLEKIPLSITNKLDSTVLARGNLNSYGDACIPKNNTFFESNFKNTNLVNPSTTILNFINKNNFLFSVPGKANVTLGGALASDTHGKDSFWGGSFISNIESFELLTSRNEFINCSRSTNPEIFYSTIGGYGLTGTVTGIKFKEAKKHFTSYYMSNISKGYGVESLIDSFNAKDNFYSVAWVDLLSKKKNWVLESSTPYNEKKETSIEIKKESSNELKISMPFIGKNYLNSMKLINFVYFNLNRENTSKLKKLENILFPLNNLSNTKNLSKKRKIVQIQFSIPLKNQNKIDGLLEMLIFKQKPLLCSIKRLGESESKKSLSFVQEGWTVAVDFPYYDFDIKSLRLFYKKLIDLECKIYLAKDSTLTEKEFKDMYPNWKEWEDIVKKIDPKNSFQSKMSNRLGLKNGY